MLWNQTDISRIDCSLDMLDRLYAGADSSNHSHQLSKGRINLTSASKQVTMRAPSFTPTLAKSFSGYDCIPPPLPPEVDPEVLSPVRVPGGVNVILMESSTARRLYRQYDCQTRFTFLRSTHKDLLCHMKRSFD